MKKFFWLPVILAFGSVAFGQDEKFEIFGGYSSLRTEAGRNHLSGWNASLAYRISGPFSVFADFSGHYSEQGSFETIRFRSNDHYFLFGPQIDIPLGVRVLNPFVRGMAGFVRESRPVVGIFPDQPPVAGPNSKNYHFAVGAGAGLDLRVNSRVSIRAIQPDWIRTVRGDAGDSNLLRLSSGVALSF